MRNIFNYNWGKNIVTKCCFVTACGMFSMLGDLKKIRAAPENHRNFARIYVHIALSGIGSGVAGAVPVFLLNDELTLAGTIPLAMITMFFTIGIFSKVSTKLTNMCFGEIKEEHFIRDYDSMSAAQQRLVVQQFREQAGESFSIIQHDNPYRLAADEELNNARDEVRAAARGAAGRVENLHHDVTPPPEEADENQDQDSDEERHSAHGMNG